MNIFNDFPESAIVWTRRGAKTSGTDAHKYPMMVFVSKIPKKKGRKNPPATTAQRGREASDGDAKRIKRCAFAAATTPQKTRGVDQRNATLCPKNKIFSKEKKKSEQKKKRQSQFSHPPL